MTNVTKTPRRGRFSLREHRNMHGDACWKLLFQPFGTNIAPDDIVNMEMQRGEVMPTGKRLQLSEKLLQVGLPFAWRYADLNAATAAYQRIYAWHDAAADAGLIGKPAAPDAE